MPSVDVYGRLCIPLSNKHSIMGVANHIHYVISRHVVRKHSLHCNIDTCMWISVVTYYIAYMYYT